MYKDKLPEADKFVKKRKRTKLWHRLLLTASAVVVFITTYMLILPAITAEVGTLNIFDELASGGGAVVEESTVTAEGTDEEITEETTEGEPSGTGVLDDGTIINIEVGKQTEDNKEEIASSGIYKDKLFTNLLAESSSGISINFTGAGTESKYNCKWDPVTDDFTADFKMSFTLSQTNLVGYDGSDNVFNLSDGHLTYTVDLPKEVKIPDNLIYSEENSTPYIGLRTGTTNVDAFKYVYMPVYDEDGVTVKNYKIVMLFLDSFLGNIANDDIGGWLQFGGIVSKESYGEDGKIIIGKDELEEPIEIGQDDIEFEDNATINKDVMVKKSGSYDNSNNTITYTVEVISKNGTNDPLVIEDSFTDNSFLKDLEAKFIGYKVESACVGIHEYDKNTITYGYGTTDVTESVTRNEDENGKVTITLPGLEAAGDGGYYGDDDNYFTKANAYKITYTYNVDPKKDVEYKSNNTAKVEFTDETAGKVITDSDSSEVKVLVESEPLITKDGTANIAAGTITWTVTVGDGEVDLKDYTLTDDKFGEITPDDLKILDSDGNHLDESLYTVTTEDIGNGNKVVTGIKFNENAAGKKYTIVYTTTYEDKNDAQTISNTATLTPPEGEGTNAGKDVNIPSATESLSFNKTLVSDGAPEDESGTVFHPTWKTTFNITERGIPADVTFTDYLSGGKTNEQYISYEDAQKIITALTKAWGEDYIKDIQFSVSNADRWNTPEDSWVDAGDVTDKGTKYYKFRFTTAKAIKQSDKTTIEYEYSTTADTSDITKDDNNGNPYTYENTIYTGNKSSSANWQFSKDRQVIKYGYRNTGNNNYTANTGDLEVITGDGTVNWIVKLRTNKDGKKYNSFTVTDTLPKGVDLQEIGILCDEYNMTYIDGYTNIDLSGGESGKTVFYEDDSQKRFNVEWSKSKNDEGQQIISLTLTKNSDDYTDFSMFPVINILYRCSIDAETASPDADTENQYTFKNDVNVTANGDDNYGRDDQTTIVTWEDETPESGELSKNGVLDQNNNRISYSLDINPEGKTYESSLGSFSLIKLIDELRFGKYDWRDATLDASLIHSSLKVYKARTDSDGAGVKDINGRLMKGALLTEDDYYWSYDERVENPEYDHAEHVKTLEMTLPNSTPLIVEYEYEFHSNLETIVNRGDVAGYPSVRNKAYLRMGDEDLGYEDEDNKDFNIIKSNTSAQASGGCYYTIVKVDRDNFFLALEGAEFDLYVYNKETEQFENKGTVTTDSQGLASISAEADNVERNSDGIVSKINTAKLKINNDEIIIDSDTLCYFVETKAPDTYRIDDTKYYFYIGSISTVLPSSCAGYVAGDSEMAEAVNTVTSHTEYITNTHTVDYYSEKTNLSVVKKWLDALGNEINKLDGSIKFKLYRVTVGADGSSSEDTTVEGDTETTTENTGNAVKLNWTWCNYYNTSDVYETGSELFDKNTTATINIKYGGDVNQYYQPPLMIVDSDTDAIIAGNDNGTDYGGSWDYDTDTFTSKIDIGEVNQNISIRFQNTTNNSTISVTGIYTAPPTTTTITEETTETTTADTNLHSYIFSADDPTGNYGTFEEFGDGYFTFKGRAFKGASPIVYEINGEAKTLDYYFPFEGNGKDKQNTYITFTAKEAGMLTLVFNSDKAGNCYIDGEAYSATNNVINVNLGAGEHKLAKNSSCYLFYISFEEGAEEIVSDGYAHSFNNGTSSKFYSIRGDQSIARSSITFHGETINTSLKMNANAEITFDAPKDGTILLMLTNPINDPVVGVNIDGKDHFASRTQKMKDNVTGKPVYQLAMRVTAGTHTIKRINSTEALLFYMEYYPDSDAIGEVSTVAPSTAGAELIGEYTISASDNWLKVFNDLLWEKLNEDTLELEGYYSYFVVEDPDSDYNISYTNNVQQGISSGAINIRNQVKEDNSTKLKVVKKWLTSDGKDSSESHVNDTVIFDLYQSINLYEGETLSTTKTIPHVFTSFDSDFYDISSSSKPYHIPSQYGTATYNGITYEYCLKMENATSIKFKAPAGGNLRLVFSKELPKDSDGNPASYGGFGFALNGEKYSYDAETGNVIGNCTVDYSDKAVIFTAPVSDGGDYEIKTNGQCYLFYMEYIYNISEAGEALYCGSYELSAEDAADGESWTKVIEGLPRYIMNDEGTETIGEYSYSVREITPDESKYAISVVYEDDGTIESEVTPVNNTVLRGTATIKNREKVIDVELPETGGKGTEGYMAGGLIISLGAGIMLYRRSRFYK